MLLDRKTFFVKERVAFAKLTDSYDILDPETQGPLGIAKEEPAAWAKWLRLLINKKLMPTTVNIYEKEGGKPAFSIHRPMSFFRSVVRVTGGDGRPLGHFKSKIFSLGGGFFVFNVKNEQVAEVKGDWKGWNFKFIGPGGREIGSVTKKWAGIGKELFTSADNYMISITGVEGDYGSAAALLLAAGLAIDLVYKEK